MAETVVRYGNGVQTKFFVPGNISRAVYVGGTLVTPSASTAETVTLSVAPGMGVPVEIDYETSTAPIKDGGLGNVVLTGTPSAGQVVVASGGSAAVWATPSFTSTGVPGWAASTAYVVAQRVITPRGFPAVCVSNHTSSTFFDAEKFLIPSDDGSTLFDFTQMPDGDINTIVPTKGRLSARSASLGTLRVLNGALDVQTPNNFYFEATLPNPASKLRHFWIIMDVMAAPPATTVIILHWLRYTQIGNGINSAAHCGFDANENGTGFAKWYSEPYPLNLGPATGPVWKPDFTVGATTVRLEMTFNPDTNKFSGWFNGYKAWEYTDPNFDAFTSAFAALQFNNAFRIKEWGISPKLPAFANAGPARGVSLNRNVYSPMPAITTTFQLLYSALVHYDSSGLIEMSSTPWINCPSGVNVMMELANADPTLGPAELALGYNYQVVASGVSCRAPFFSSRKGPPNTSENVGIWVKANSTGASVERNFNGSSQGSLRWYNVR